MVLPRRRSVAKRGLALGYESYAMKLFLLRGAVVLGLGVAGCALGSAADLTQGKVGLDPSAPPVTADGNGNGDGSAGGRDEIGGGDASAVAPEAGAALDATVADAPARSDASPTSACAFTGQLVAFDLDQAMGAQADLSASSKAAGLGTTTLRRGGVVTVPTSHAMNASDWPSGGVDLTKHFAFTVTPPAGCALTVSSLAVELKASNTGPASAAAGTSIDGFAARQTLTVTSGGGAVVVPFAAGTRATAALEVRIFGFDASSSGGTLRLQGTLALTGTLGPL